MITWKKKKINAETLVKTPDGAEIKQIEPVSEDLSQDMPTASVGISLARTVNLGDYNSLKIQVTLFMPCIPEAVDTTSVFVTDWVDNRLAALYDKYIPESQGGK